MSNPRQRVLLRQPGMVGRRGVRGNRNDGQALVEFALAVPLLVLFLVAIMYFGKAFYIKQIVSMAAQQGAIVLSRTPGLNDPTTRQQASGFTPDGQMVNNKSVIPLQLAAGRLLAKGSSNLPSGSKVLVLPWDGSSASNPALIPPPGTVGVEIDYPFVFLGDSPNTASKFGSGPLTIWSGWGGAPITFLNWTITERAFCSEEIYQDPGG